MNLEYDSLNQQLWTLFPSLKKHRYTQMIGNIEAGPYVVFGVMFNQYLVDLANTDDVQARTEVSKFIEDMVTARDQRVSDMLISEVLPTLSESQAMVEAYWPLLGAMTRRQLQLLSPWFSDNVTLPSLE